MITASPCPLCDGQLVERRRHLDGTHFWGCMRFPQCRGTRNLDGTVGLPAAEPERETEAMWASMRAELEDAAPVVELSGEDRIAFQAAAQEMQRAIRASALERRDTWERGFAARMAAPRRLTIEATGTYVEDRQLVATLPPPCPICGGPMVQRTGARSGNLYWCCARHACTGTRALNYDRPRHEPALAPAPRVERVLFAIDPIEQEFARHVPARTDAERCIRHGCDLTREPNRSFCRGCDPATRVASATSTPAARNGLWKAVHATHRMPESAPMTALQCLDCRRVDDALATPRGRPELGRVSLIELN